MNRWFRIAILYSIFLTLTALFLYGCGGSGGGGSGSGVLGITTGPSSTPAAGVKVFSSVSSLRPGESTGITVQVNDETGSPADGVKVYLTSQLGSILDQPNGDSTKGWYYSKYTAGTTSGVDICLAFALGGSASLNLTITPIAAPTSPSKVEVKTTVTSLKSGESTGIIVHVNDQNGDPADQAQVNLTSQLGSTLTPPSGSTTKGWFYSTYTAGVTAGADICTAYTLGESASLTMQITPPSPVLASPTQVQVFLGDDTTPSNLPVTVTAYVSKGGEAVNAGSLLFSSSNGGTFQAALGQVNNGWYSTTFTPPTDVTSTIISGSINGVASQTTLKITPVTPSVILYLGSGIVSPSTPTSPTSVTVSAYATQNGEPAKSGSVVFSSSLGGSFQETFKPVSDGWVSTSFTPPSQTGQTLITANFLGVATSTLLSITNVTAPTRFLKIQAHPEVLFAGQSTVILAQVTDVNGQPADAHITFATHIDGTFSASSGNTANGVLSTTFTTKSETGTATISAYYFDQQATTTIIVKKPKILVEMVCPNTRIASSSTSSNPLQIKAFDELQNPLSSVYVNLSGEGMTFTPSYYGVMTTDSQGLWNGSFVASGSPPIATITALVSGSVGSVTIQIY